MIDRPEEIGGILAAGSSAAGNRYALGRVRDLSATAGPLGSVSISFDYDGVADAARFLGLIDGIPSLRLALGEPWDTEPLGVGTFEVEVLPLDATRQDDPFLAPDLIGNKVFLRWDAPADTATLAGYRVYGVALVGSITVLEVGTVSPVSVLGSGAPVVTGGWLPAQIEQVLRVEVDGGEWELRSGATVLATGPVEIGIEQITATGLSITWQPGTYVDGDEWEIPLEFPRYFVAPAGGTYKVVAVDVSGLETELATAPSVTVNPIGVPAAPVVTGYAFNTATRVATITVTSTLGNTVGVFSDIDVPANGAAPYIEEDWPIATRTGSGTITLTVPASMPSFRCYVRATANATGRMERNATVYTFAAPAVGASITGAQVAIEAVTVATGYILVVDWSVSIEGATPTEVLVYTSPSETGTQTLLETIPVAVGLEDFPVYRRTTELDLGGPGTIWLEFRAVYADGTVKGIVDGPHIPLDSGVSQPQNLLGWET